MNGESITAARHSSGGKSTEIATTCGPRDHHFVGLLVREVEDLVEELLLACSTTPGLAGLRHDQADVLLRVGDDSRPRGLDSEKRVTALAETWRNHTRG